MVWIYKNLDSQLIKYPQFARPKNLHGLKWTFEVWCNKSCQPTVHKKEQQLTICCHLYIRMDILLHQTLPNGTHKTLPNGTHLSFYVTSPWEVILYCYVLLLGPYHASILHPPQALMLKNIQRVCSKAQVPVPQNTRGNIRGYQSCPCTE
jgi:hypothetical protein